MHTHISVPPVSLFYKRFFPFVFGSFETGSHVDLAGLEPAMWIRPLWDHVTLSTTCPRIWGGGAARASYTGWP